MAQRSWVRASAEHSPGLYWLGGDDVQQLCEAGEDEFLEIMALVGMASKPLHVRRLQKALQEWLANPTAFDVPKKFPTLVMSMVGGGGASSGGRPGSTPSPMSSTEASLSPAHSMTSSQIESQQQNLLVKPNGSTSNALTTSITHTTSTNHSVGSNHGGGAKLTADQQLQQMSAQVLNSNLSINCSTSARLTSSPSGNIMASLGSDQSPPWALQTRGPTPLEAAASLVSGGRRGRGQFQGNVNGSSSEQPSPPDSPQEFKDVIKDGVYNPNDAAYIPTVSHPALMDHQISAIAAAAAILARDLPPIEPKSLPKKQNSKDITTVMMMSSDDPNRLDAMRKYAAIYGRFDSKRKNHRPMSLHEISVNEAAAQLCNHFPALLTRREELFPLARQVVRDSGYQYSKGHSRAAEVLVQPKLEPLDQQMSTSAPGVGQASHLPTFLTGHGPAVTSPEEDAYNELQNELAHITLSLSEMDKEQARIRAALRVLLEANDLEQVRGLTAEMDVLNDRQEALAKRRQRVVTAMSRYKKGGTKASGGFDRLTHTIKQQSSKQGHKKNFGNNLNNNDNIKVSNSNTSIYGINLSMNSNGNSGVYSNNNNNNFGAISNLHGISSTTASINANTGDTEAAASNNPLNTLYLAAMQNQRDSLFEEGLRIATQYGMSDFAKELIGMKSQSKVLGSDDSGISVGVSTSAGVLSQSSSTVGNVSTTPSASLVSSSSSSSAASPAVTAVSSDSISASSSEYLSPATGCRIHTPPSATASPSVSTINVSATPLSSSSASLLFPSSVTVISPKQSKSTKTSKRSLDNPSPCASPCPQSTKSSKLSHSVDAAPSPTSSATSHSPPSSSGTPATSTKAQTAQEPDKANATVATTTTTTTSQNQGSTSTTTTTVTTKAGQVVEIEPRRSSRRRNGEPDYYLINGGEKRFRANSSGSTSGSGSGSNQGGVGSSPSGRRGSSSDRRKSAASADGAVSISSPSKPYTLDPCINNNVNNNNNNNNSNNNNASKGSGKNNKGNNSIDNSAIKLDISEIRFRNPAAEIHKVRMGFQQRFEPLDKDKR
ncbi:NGFI-A-binding protein-like protein [Elysia marginata]|uniref:NGFI-A-binding protein-like protein n=1 Tax=Elysia marginata TaxID=1093978 RepID=A0AAV4EV43_9GAST|nr:NGFI-A-binding protein-like protein [Elysia marginata]